MGARDMSDGFRIDGVRRLLNLGRRARIEQNIDDEIRFHIESRMRDLVAGGYAADQARDMAAAEFGSLTLAREALSVVDRRIEARTRRLAWRETIGQDARDAWRSVTRASRRRP